MATIAEKPAVAPATPALNKDEILRYSRHLIMPEVGMDGQLKLKAGTVGVRVTAPENPPEIWAPWRPSIPSGFSRKLMIGRLWTSLSRMTAK